MRNGGKGAIGSDPSVERRNIASVRIRHESIFLFITLPGVPKTANANPAGLMNRRWFPSVMRLNWEGGGGVTAHPGP